MIRVTLRSLAGRTLRAALTALAIVLGVAMAAGTYIFTDTIATAFGGIIASSYANTSAVISGTGQPGSGQPGSGETPGVPAGLLAAVRALPEVTAAAGGYLDLDDSRSVALTGPDGTQFNRGATSIGLGVDPADQRFNPLRLTSGRWAAGPGEVVLDAGTLQRHQLAVGGRVGVAAHGRTTTFTITGVARLGGVRSVGSATIAVFDVATARTLYGKPGQFGSISIAAAPGVGQQQLVGAVRPLLPPTAEVHTADEIVAKAAASNARDAKQISTFLLAFAGIALFVGAFVIANTLTITVAQRTRELATLRTLGANRRQVLGAVLLEALLLGVVASAAGLLLGLGLARGLDAMLAAFGIDLPEAGMVVAARTVVVSLVLGTSVTLLASVFPAIRATRVPPILAVREGSTVPPARYARYAPYVSLILTAGAVVAICAALFVSGLAARTVLLLLAGGSAGLFLGVALLSARLVRPLAAVLGWPAARLAGPAGRLARANAVRNPGRTAATAAALMIGLTLVTFVAVLGRGVQASTGAAVDRFVRADYVVAPPADAGPLPVAVARALRDSAAVTTVTAGRQETVRVGGAETAVSGVDGNFTRLSRLDWAAGSDQTLTGLARNEAVVHTRFAKDHGLRVGDAVRIATPAGREVSFVVRGTYLDSLLAPIAVSQPAFDATFPHPQDAFALVAARGGPSADRQATLERALAGFPDATVSTKAGFVEAQNGQLDDVMNMLYGLLGLSVVVSLFGMVNTLALSVFERTRELGMLRAVGMTRRQARRMVRHESVVTALIGAALGLPLGTGLAALVTYALRNEGLRFDLPVPTLAAFLVIAVASGVIAAVLPARRAARLDPLRALQYE
jgi:putative ABC transport system permease protein